MSLYGNSDSVVGRVTHSGHLSAATLTSWRRWPHLPLPTGWARSVFLAVLSPAPCWARRRCHLIQSPLRWLRGALSLGVQRKELRLTDSVTHGHAQGV